MSDRSVKQSSRQMYSSVNHRRELWSKSRNNDFVGVNLKTNPWQWMDQIFSWWRLVSLHSKGLTLSLPLALPPVEIRIWNLEALDFGAENRKSHTLNRHHLVWMYNRPQNLRHLILFCTEAVKNTFKIYLSFWPSPVLFCLRCLLGLSCCLLVSLLCNLR